LYLKATASAADPEFVWQVELCEEVRSGCPASLEQGIHANFDWAVLEDSWRLTSWGHLFFVTVPTGGVRRARVSSLPPSLEYRHRGPICLSFLSPRRGAGALANLVSGFFGASLEIDIVRPFVFVYVGQSRLRQFCVFGIFGARLQIDIAGPFVFRFGPRRWGGNAGDLSIDCWVAWEISL